MTGIGDQALVVMIAAGTEAVITGASLQEEVTKRVLLAMHGRINVALVALHKILVDTILPKTLRDSDLKKTILSVTRECTTREEGIEMITSLAEGAIKITIVAMKMGLDMAWTGAAMTTLIRKAHVTDMAETTVATIAVAPPRDVTRTVHMATTLGMEVVDMRTAELTTTGIETLIMPGKIGTITQGVTDIIRALSVLVMTCDPTDRMTNVRRHKTLAMVANHMKGKGLMINTNAHNQSVVTTLMQLLVGRETNLQAGTYMLGV